MSVNVAIIVGNLGRDPEVRFSTNGKAVCKFSVATSEKWTDGGGEKHENTTWHDVVAFGKLGELCGQYLAKGRQAYVQGRIQKRQYDDKDGNKRWAFEIVADKVEFLGGAQGQRGQQHGNDSQPADDDPWPED